jgi:6-pyruvoyl-tetrahydropterin synthase
MSVANDYEPFEPFDFSRYKELKELLIRQFDHTLLVASTDPLLEVFQDLAAGGAADLRIVEDPSPRGSARWVFDACSEVMRENSVRE